MTPLLFPILIYTRSNRIQYDADLDLSGFNQGVRAIGEHFGGLSTLGQGFESVAQGIGFQIGGGIAGAATQMGEAVGRALGDGIQLGRDLETGLTKVASLVDLNDSQFQQLGQGVLSTFADLPQDINSLNEALFDLVSAGVSVDEANQALALSAQAATGGFTSVNTTANLGIRTLNAFNLEIGELNRVFDVFQETARIGVTTFEQMASQIGQAIPAAQGLGVELEEFGGIFAAATRGGLDVTQTVEGMENVFQDLVRQKDKLEELGNAPIFDEGKFRGLLPVFEDLSQTLSSLSDEGRAERIKDLGFSEPAQRLVLTITGNMDRFRESVDSVEGSAGAMGRAFNTAMESSENQLRILSNRMKAFTLTAIAPLLDSLNMGIGRINRLFDGFDSSQALAQFQTLQSTTQTQIQTLETLRDRYTQTTNTLRNTTAGTEAHERASQDQRTIISQIQDILPTSVTQYNDLGEAIGISTARINDFLTAQRQMLASETLQALQKTTEATIGYTRELENSQTRLDELTGSIATLEARGENTFIGIIDGARTLVQLTARVRETFGQTLDPATRFKVEEGLSRIIERTANLEERTELASEFFRTLTRELIQNQAETARAVSRTQVSLGASEQAIRGLLDAVDFTPAFNRFVELNALSDLTAGQMKTMSEIVGEAIQLGFGDSAAAAIETLTALSEAIGLIEAPILPAAKSQDVSPVIPDAPVKALSDQLQIVRTEMLTLEHDLVTAGIVGEERLIRLAESRLEKLQEINAAELQNDEERQKLAEDRLQAEIDLADRKLQSQLDTAESTAKSEQDAQAKRTRAIQEHHATTTRAEETARAERQRILDNAERDRQSQLDRQLEADLRFEKRGVELQLRTEQEMEANRDAFQRREFNDREAGARAVQRLLDANALATEENAIENARFLAETNQISLEEYRDFLLARLEALRANGKQFTDAWRKIAGEIDNIDKKLADQLELEITIAAQKTANQVDKAFRLLFDINLPQFVNGFVEETSRAFLKLTKDADATFDTIKTAAKSGLKAAFTQDPVAALELGLIAVNGLMSVFGRQTDRNIDKLNDLRDAVREASDTIRGDLASAISDSFNEGVEGIDFDALINAIVRARVSEGIADAIISQLGIDEALLNVEKGARAFDRQPRFAIRDAGGVFEDDVFLEQEADKRLLELEARGFRAEKVQLDLEEKLNAGLQALGDAAEALPDAIENVKAQLPEGVAGFLDAFEGARADIERATPAQSFRAVTEPQGNAIISGLGQIASRIDREIEAINRVHDAVLGLHGTALAEPPMQPAPPQRVLVEDVVRVEIGGQVMMEANGLEDIDVDAIAQGLRANIQARRNALIGRR
jgi:TP901 family phage tail tape measure protein